MNITPTVGRIVYFAPSNRTGSSDFTLPARGEPLAAIIAAVLPTGALNLAVFDALGHQHARLNVPLVQDGDETPEDGCYAYWMPYQLAQAGIKPLPGSQVAPSMALPSIDQAQQAKLGQLLASAEPSPTKGPSVSEERINMLVASLTYETARIPGTTSTVATARLPGGFVVAIGHEATVSPENFDAEKGRQYAIGTATKLAREKLWEFEGYVLASQLGRTLAEAPVLSSAATQRAIAMQRLADDGRPPHQVRVFEEKWELDERLNRLQAFLVTPMFEGLDADEKHRMQEQAKIMGALSEVLAQRIAAF